MSISITRLCVNVVINWAVVTLCAEWRWCGYVFGLHTKWQELLWWGYVPPLLSYFLLGWIGKCGAAMMCRPINVNGIKIVCLFIIITQSIPVPTILRGVTDAAISFNSTIGRLKKVNRRPGASGRQQKASWRCWGRREGIGWLSAGIRLAPGISGRSAND